jgi:hypothetical protein
LRDGEQRIRLINTGHLVWLFDDSHRELIQRSGALNFGSPGAEIRFRAVAKDGVLLGYALERDDDLDVSVIVGQPLRDEELAGARWHEPQHGWLRLPSGVFRINSNDTVLAEIWNAGDHGVRVEVMPGNYIVSLYRVNRVAMAREGRLWHGPQEVIVLTRGGTNVHGVPFVLPFPGLTRSSLTA